MNKQTIYLASSWRNEEQQKLVATLRAIGHEVYDFKNPADGESGFGWKQITEHPTEQWTPSVLKNVLTHPIARRGHALDQGGMDRATACVLLLPCGSSAHLEAGWCAGKGIPTIAYAPTTIREPELMYLTFTHGTNRDTGYGPIITAEHELFDWLQICNSPLRLYLLDDGERTWFSARSSYDAARVFSSEIDAIGEAEKLEMADKVKLLPDDEQMTVNIDGIKTTKTAAQWAASGRGIIASTCE